MSLVYFKTKKDLLDSVQLILASMDLVRLREDVVRQMKGDLPEAADGKQPPMTVVTQTITRILAAHHRGVLGANGHAPEALQDIQNAVKVFPGDPQVRSLMLSLCSQEEALMSNVQEALGILSETPVPLTSPDAMHPIMMNDEFVQHMQTAADMLPPEIKSAMDAIQHKIMTRGPQSLTRQEVQQKMVARQMLMMNLQMLGALPQTSPEAVMREVGSSLPQRCRPCRPSNQEEDAEKKTGSEDE